MNALTEKNIEKIAIVYEFPKYLDIIQNEVDRVSHIFKNSATLEYRIQYQIANLLRKGYQKESQVRRTITKTIAAEMNRTNKSLAKHNVSSFTKLGYQTQDGEWVSFEAPGDDDIGWRIELRETIKKIVSLATNDEERIIINGLADGLSDASIGELLAQLNPMKKCDTHRKSVRKFKERCKLALVG